MPAKVSLAAGEQMAPELEEIRQMVPALREMGNRLFVDHPEQARRALVEAHVSEEWLRIGFLECGELVAVAEELQAGPAIPDVPVNALTVAGADAADQAVLAEHLELVGKARAGKTRMGAALVGSVSRGEQRVLPDSGRTS